MSSPVISIIVPVYKVEAWLERCVDSILAQTLADFEVILIDDGSPDGSGAICDRYAERDSRVRVLHTVNRGVGAARNAGLDAARGEFLGFVDSDDWIDPDMFEVLHREIELAKADLASCSISFEQEGRRIPARKSGLRSVWDQAEFTRMISEDVTITNHVWNKLFRREWWADARFREGCFYEDIYMYSLLLPRLCKATYLEVPKYHYRINQGGICGGRTPSSQWDCYDAFRERWVWLRASHPQWEPYAVTSMVRPGLQVYDAFILGRGMPGERAQQVVADFRQTSGIIPSAPRLPRYVRVRVWVLLNAPRTYRVVRKFCALFG